MFKKVNVPVLGIVENMSYFQCPHCGERSDIFGHGGARHEAERLGVPFLGEVPLHMAIRDHFRRRQSRRRERAGRAACGDLSRHRRQGSRSASGRDRRGLKRRLKQSMPQEFTQDSTICDFRNQRCHAFVAFSPVHSVLSPAPNAFGCCGHSRRGEGELSKWETPLEGDA